MPSVLPPPVVGTAGVLFTADSTVALNLSPSTVAKISALSSRAKPTATATCSHVLHVLGGRSGPSILHSFDRTAFLSSGFILAKYFLYKVFSVGMSMLASSISWSLL